MRRLLPLVLALFACAPVAPPPKPAPPPPQLAATAAARRVVLLSFDGLGADALARQTNLPAFERLAREGASARVINVNPTLTMPTHVSILTGADPQRTGVVSNRFHLAGRPVEEVARGMETDSDVETLIEAARRQGKRVGSVSYPTIDNHSPRRTADFGLAWTTPLTKARLVKLTRSDFKREWVPPTWTDRPQRRRSFSPIMRARIEWSAQRARVDVDVVAYDTTDDARENYDVYYVEAGEQELTLDPHGWFAISQQTAAGLLGSWSKILTATTTLDLTIFWGSIGRNDAWPDAFRDRLDREIGFWPGVPEEELEVDNVLFTEQLQRIADFYTRAQTFTIAQETFDLLLLYQPEVDTAAHQSLGAPGGEEVLRAAFEAADRAVAAMAEALDDTDALVVTGDHGLVTVEREVRVNTLLAEHGFAPRWHAYTSGAFAQIYRFSGDDDADAVVAMLNATGQFERIEKKTAASHRNAGDISAWAFPTIALSSMNDSPSIVTPPPHGQHGGLNTHRELHPPLFAIGAGVTPGNLGEIEQTRIAGYVASLLGIRFGVR
jgi:predicted AlkP superfamily pyrophosphatase or phosphodiesterase